MPVHADDRLLWIAIGSGLLLAANAIPYFLRYIRIVTEVHEHEHEHEHENPTQRQREDAEDALKLSTLEKLARGPSYKLRASAVKIIAERSTRDATRKLLLQDLASQNSSKRDQALHALWFLLSDASLKSEQETIQQLLADTLTFNALTRCLVNLLPLHKNGPAVRADNPTAASPLLPHNRPSSETFALFILRKILTDQSTAKALSAGLVSKWLAYYPFPCALPENGARRQDVVKLFKTWGSDDPLMESIIKTLRRHPESLKQLRIHGLTGSSYGEAEVDTGDTQDVLMKDVEDAAPIILGSSPTRPGSSWARRPPDPASNQAERAVRQRRREAAVYSEGNAPLTQDNIFQRQSSSLGPTRGPNAEVEAEVARTIEERQRVEVEDLGVMIDEALDGDSIGRLSTS